jgi:hypothetical protein
MRLTHERFRSDVTGLATALKGILADAQAARQARGRRGWHDLLTFIAKLPARESWRTPIWAVAALAVGWALPGSMKLGNLPSVDSLTFCLIISDVLLFSLLVAGYARAASLTGSMFAALWLAGAGAVSESGDALAQLITLSVTQSYDFMPLAIGQLTALSIVLVTGFGLAMLRRANGSGSEFAIYAVGMALATMALGSTAIYNNALRLPYFSTLPISKGLDASVSAALAVAWSSESRC